MELRTTEEKIDELIELYTAVRNAKEDGRADGFPQTGTGESRQWNQLLPEIPRRALVVVNNNEPTMTATDPTATTTPTEQLQQQQQQFVVISSPITTTITSTIMTLAEMVSNLEQIQSDLVTMESKMIRFRQRLEEKDPITGKQRYGEKTQKRVQILVNTYECLTHALQIQIKQQQQDEQAANNINNNNETVPPTLSDTPPNTNTSTTPSTPWIINQLQQRLQQEQAEAEAQRQEVERKQLEAQQEQERIEQQVKQEEEQRQREYQAQIAEQEAAEQAELRQRAEQVRVERQLAVEAERAWIASISVSREGVQEQLQILKDSTAHDPIAQKIAFTSLYQLYKQINAHPEEVTFRRVRRDHEQFNQDIGRHKGGKEVLVASGFVVGAIDDVPCFISKEPNLEQDMDGWAAWFDLLKATLQLLESYQ